MTRAAVPYRVGEGGRGRGAIHAVAARVEVVRQCVLCNVYILGLFLKIQSKVLGLFEIH